VVFSVFLLPPGSAIELILPFACLTGTGLTGISLVSYFLCLDSFLLRPLN
jgi:hypothetical protein